MSELIFSVQAPSNIALIKYMGKKDSVKNIPENPSLSLTLSSLCTAAELRVGRAGSGTGELQWIPEPPGQFAQSSFHKKDSLLVPQLDQKGVTKLLRHFVRVEKAVSEILPAYGFQIQPHSLQGRSLHLRTANTFPASSGIASSASSFAAMTWVFAAAYSGNFSLFIQIWDQDVTLRRALARVTREGSGSSCRSFEGPWVSWEGEEARRVEGVNLPPMAHFVVLIRTEPKKVSSSDAHLQVKTSPLWERRVERVQVRYQQLLAALRSGDLNRVAQLSWAEAWEMHSLFHTSEVPFTYWDGGTVEGLKWFAEFLANPVSPPIVTLDAGPNIHVIVEKAHREIWRARLQERFKNTGLLEDEPGNGAQYNGV